MSKRDWPRCGDENGCDSAVRRDPVTGKGPAVDLRCARHKVDDTLTRPDPDPVVYTEDEAEQEVLDDSPASVERITSLRAALREGLLTDQVANLITEQIVEALQATKSTFLACPRCKHRSQVQVSDLGTRTGAALRLLEELEGRQLSAAETKLTTEQRHIEARQVRLSKMLGVDLDAEISRLSAQLGVDPKSPPDKRFGEFSTVDIVRFIERNSESDGE